MVAIIPRWADDWKVVKNMRIPINKISARIRNDNAKLIIVAIDKTPHFKFIRDYIKFGKKYKWRQSDYFNYAEKHISGKKSVRRYLSLYHNILEESYLGEKYNKNLCLIYRRFPFGNYKIFDGIHRVAILAALGFSEIEVAVVKRKKHWLYRLTNKLETLFVKGR